MRVGVVGFVAALGIVLSSDAIAQNVVISPEGRTIIHEYVIKEKIKPHKFRGHVAVGTRIPEDVKLMPVPEAWGPELRIYSFVYTSDYVILVNPSTRRVIQLIELEQGPHGA